MKHRARKRFGQNFLVDEQVIERLVAAIAPKQGELLIEIGPGREAMTTPLIASGADLQVVEIDRDLAAALSRRYPAMKVINEDALRVDFAAIADGKRYRLVGNLPYNISTPLLFHLLAQDPAPLDMHFMLQKEVVDRMHASPGGGDYGRLSLMCQNLAEVTPLLPVRPDAFEPRPRVESTFVRVTPRATPKVPPHRQETFSLLVKQAFSMRRKTIRKSLRQWVDAGTLEALNIDGGNRPEQLTLEEFDALAQAVMDDEPKP